MSEDEGTRHFTVAGARALLPTIQAEAERLVELRWRLADLQHGLQHGDAGLGGVPEAKALEARVHEIVEGFREKGVQVRASRTLAARPKEWEGSATGGGTPRLGH